MSPLQCGRCGAEARHMTLAYSAYDRCEGCQCDVISCPCPPGADRPAPEQTPIPLAPTRAGHVWEAPDEIPF